MKDLRKAYEFGREICDACGIPIQKVIRFGVKRSTCNWGTTHYNHSTKEYIIYINPILLEDNVDDISLYNTLVHELIHTAPNCMNHGKLWKEYAAKVNKEFNLNIKTTNSEEEKGVKIRTPIEYKYSVKCPDCGEVWNYQRMSKVVKTPSDYKCGHCRTTLIRVK